MARMKTCKRCAAEIPATAPRCKHCGSLQRAGCLGAVVVILCVFLVLVWIAIHRMYAGPGPQTAASQAENLCEQAVRKAASHPASVDFSEFGKQPPMNMRDGSYQVLLAFKEKDALGDTIARDAICTVKDGKLQTFREPRP
jgi:hypothetical protein